ncbi:hypothetical protein VCHA37P202_80071 [Vibrio chagasii]|nr:hypothetical protein VCHA37P202_80071 [Vibrio chagasii]
MFSLRCSRSSSASFNKSILSVVGRLVRFSDLPMSFISYRMGVASKNVFTFTATLNKGLARLNTDRK